MVINVISQTQELAAWTRKFAQITLPIFSNPSVEVVRQAIATYFPEEMIKSSSNISAEMLLEEVLGIAVIVEYGREKIGWTATTDPVEAEKMRHLYSSAPYSKIRHGLGIDGHWIFLPDPQFLDHYFSEDLYEKAPDPVEVYEQFPELLHLKDRQECVVVKL